MHTYIHIYINMYILYIIPGKDSASWQLVAVVMGLKTMQSGKKQRNIAKINPNQSKNSPKPEGKFFGCRRYWLYIYLSYLSFYPSIYLYILLLHPLLKIVIPFSQDYYWGGKQNQKDLQMGPLRQFWQTYQKMEVSERRRMDLWTEGPQEKRPVIVMLRLQRRPVSRTVIDQGSPISK